MTVGSEVERLSLLVHEVRSPVAALAAIAEAVREDVSDPESLRELLRLAVRAARSIERIVGDAALGSLRIERVDLRGLLQDAVSAAVLAGNRVRLSLDRELELHADPIRLRQAVDNLIHNAVVHSGSSAEVVVHAEPQEGSVLIAVSDRGRGIAPVDHDRVFERGTRLGGAVDGSGLGLDVVREVVHAHGGTVAIDSDLGRGATFTITIPVRRP